MRRWRSLVVPIAFVVLLVLVGTTWTPLRDLDLDVADGLNRATAPHPDLVTFWKVVSTVGQPLTFEVLAVVVAVVLWRRSGQVRLAVFTATTVVLAGTVSTIMKLLVGRDRPHVADTIAHANGSSFPSGHAMSSFVGVTVLLLVAVPQARRRLRAPMVAAGLLVALLIAFSRLCLGVHYLSDVVAGWLLGASWVLLTRRLVLTALIARAPRAPGPASPDRPRGTPVA